VLASLNHPNIAQIHGLERGPAAFDSAQAGESGHAVQALVMEFVDGPTLADRIVQAPIPVDEALAIARQIGPTSRFGPTAASSAISTSVDTLANSPTITGPAMTAAGVILRTAALPADRSRARLARDDWPAGGRRDRSLNRGGARRLQFAGINPDAMGLGAV
jgi:hypothetical protein